MLDFLKEQRKIANAYWTAHRHDFDETIKAEVSASAKVGRTTAYVYVQGQLNGEIVERRVTELGCRVIKSGNNWSWYWVQFEY